MLVETKHHQAFLDLPLKLPASDDNFDIDFFGVVQRKGYYANNTSAALNLNIPVPKTLQQQEYVEEELREAYLPILNEDYFEWVDVIESAKLARRRFIMIELGAGYGKWICEAVGVLRAVNPIPYKLIVVEAEPMHFRYLKQHLKDNNLLNSSVTTICAAMASHNGFVKFHIGDPTGWYGQYTDSEIPTRQEKLHFWLSKFQLANNDKSFKEIDTTVVMQAISLDRILKPLPYVDLIDLDVQGVELEVLSVSIDMINRKVKRLHIGTHTRAIETGLRAIFGGCGWKAVNDYPCRTNGVSTPFGTVDFQDGVQTWLNPRFIV